jgi:hypothetical protein
MIFFPGHCWRQRIVLLLWVSINLLGFLCVGAGPTSLLTANDAVAQPVTMPSRERPYTPVYAKQRAPATQEERGTLKGDFLWAANATTLEMAAVRWEAFLTTYKPTRDAQAPEQEYEDAFQANHIAAAQYELMRVYYLLGRVEDGDRLLRELDPLDLLN